MAKLAEQFVCVRVQSMNGINIGLFQFDYDLTWMGFFMDADDRFYARYGGREDSGPETLLSKASLLTAMREAASLHKAKAVQTSKYEPKPAPPRTPEDIPTMKRMMDARKGSKCIHCHDVKVAELRHRQDQGTFSKDLIFGYQPPSTLGLTLDEADQKLVKDVKADSLAARAGVRAGDRLRMLDGQRLTTAADLARVLELTPKEARLPLEIERDGKSVKLELALAGGWKTASDPWWRESTHVAGPNAGFWGMKLTDAEREAVRIPKDVLALKVTFLFPNHPTPPAAGLRVGDVVVEVDGDRKPLNIHQFHARFNMQRNYGEKVPVVIQRDGKEVKLTLKLPERAMAGD